MREDGRPLNIDLDASALIPGNGAYPARKKFRNRLLSNPVSWSCGNVTGDAGEPAVASKSRILRLSLTFTPNFIRLACPAPLESGSWTFIDPVTSRSVVLKISVCHALSVARDGSLREGFGWMFLGSMADADTFGANVTPVCRKIVSRRFGWCSCASAHATR